MGEPMRAPGAEASERSPAEPASSERDRYLRQIAENVGDVIWHNRPDGTLAWISPSVTRVLGWRPEEVLGRAITDFVHPDDQAAALRGRTRASVGLAAEEEVRIQRRDGSWCPMGVRGGPYVDATGQQDGTVAVGRDVSSRHSSHHHLEESERRFRLIAVLTDALARHTSAEDLAAAAASILVRELGDACVVSLLDDAQETLTLVAVAHHDPDRERALKPLLGIGPVPWAKAVSSPAIAVRRSLQIGTPDLELSGRGGQILGEYLDRYGTSGMVLLPLFAEGAVIGSMVMSRDGSSHTYQDPDRELLEEVGRRLALYLHDASLRSQLAQAKHDFEVIAASASDIVVRLDADWRADWVSPSVTERLGWPVGAVVGVTVTDLVHPDDRAAMNQELAAPVGGVATVRLRRHDGSYLWVAASCRQTTRADGRPNGLVLALRDVDAEISAREALLASERTFRLALHEAPIGMALVGVDGKLLEVNQALCDIVGYDGDELATRTLDDITHPDDRDQDADSARLLAGETPALRTAKRLVRKDGRTVWVDVAVSVVRTGDGNPVRFVSQIADVDASRRAQQALEFQARHDGLTGLPNRAELVRTIGERSSSRRRPGPFFSLLFCDLDHFKHVNDTHGHAAGDAVLRATSGRIRQRVRSADVVARMGGDEFVVVLDAVHSLESATVIAEQILAAVAQPMRLPEPGGVITPTMSVGVVVATAGAGVDQLLAKADLALYEAKNGGRNRVVAHPTIES